MFSSWYPVLFLFSCSAAVTTAKVCSELCSDTAHAECLFVGHRICRSNNASLVASSPPSQRNLTWVCQKDKLPNLSLIAQPTVGRNKPETAVCTDGSDIDIGALTSGLCATQPATLVSVAVTVDIVCNVGDKIQLLYRLSKHVRVSDWYYLNGYVLPQLKAGVVLRV